VPGKRPPRRDASPFTRGQLAQPIADRPSNQPGIVEDAVHRRSPYRPLRFRGHLPEQSGSIGYVLDKHHCTLRAWRSLAGPHCRGLRRTLEAAGVEFTNGDKPGVRVRRK